MHVFACGWVVARWGYLGRLANLAGWVVFGCQIPRSLTSRRPREQCQHCFEGSLSRRGIHWPLKRFVFLRKKSGFHLRGQRARGLHCGPVGGEASVRGALRVLRAPLFMLSEHMQDTLLMKYSRYNSMPSVCLACLFSRGTAACSAGTTTGAGRAVQNSGAAEHQDSRSVCLCSAGKCGTVWGGDLL